MIVIWLALALLLIERTTVVQSSLFASFLTKVGIGGIIPFTFTTVAKNAADYHITLVSLLPKPLPIQCVSEDIDKRYTNPTKTYHDPIHKI